MSEDGLQPETETTLNGGGPDVVGAAAAAAGVLVPLVVSVPVAALALEVLLEVTVFCLGVGDVGVIEDGVTAPSDEPGVPVVTGPSEDAPDVAVWGGPVAVVDVDVSTGKVWLLVVVVVEEGTEEEESLDGPGSGVEREGGGEDDDVEIGGVSSKLIDKN
jgi:hypothetical protein